MYSAEVRTALMLLILLLLGQSIRDISMVRPPDEEMQDLIGKGLPPQGMDLGGMSGRPVVSSILEPSGELSFALSGVIYERGSAFDIVKAVRADIIDDYGTIRWQQLT